MPKTPARKRAKSKESELPGGKTPKQTRVKKPAKAPKENTNTYSSCKNYTTTANNPQYCNDLHATKILQETKMNVYTSI